MELNDNLDFQSYIEKIVPCYKTMKELEEYLVRKYNAKIKNEIDESRINTLKSMIVHKHFPNLIPGGRVVIDDLEGLTKEKEVALLEEIEFIRSLPKEKLNLDLINYEFDVYKNGIKIGAFRVLLERNIGIVYPVYSLKFANDTYKKEMSKICGDILLFQGVSQRDIDERTQRYLDYIATKFNYQYE